MSTVHLCDGKDHVQAEGDCPHIFAVARVTVDVPVMVRHLCLRCLLKHVDTAVGSYKVEPLKEGAK